MIMGWAKDVRYWGREPLRGANKGDKDDKRWSRRGRSGQGRDRWIWVGLRVWVVA